MLSNAGATLSPTLGGDGWLQQSVTSAGPMAPATHVNEMVEEDALLLLLRPEIYGTSSAVAVKMLGVDVERTCIDCIGTSFKDYLTICTVPGQKYSYSGHIKHAQKGQ